MTLCERCEHGTTCETREEGKKYYDEKKIKECTHFKARSDVLCIEYGSTAFETACKLIDATYEYTNCINQDCIVPFFERDDLLKIGKHLVNYVETEMVGDEDA